MLSEKFDFYSPSNITIKDLDPELQRSLNVVAKLDEFTYRHSQNVSNLCVRICQYMNCNNQFTIHCMVAGFIHDIGKMFIPPEIINKPDRLTDEEYEIVKQHTTKGYEFCMKDRNLIPYSDGPWYHHEALDGSGYPRGLKKIDIPYSGQIIRVADEYDALVTKRQYKTHVNISETLKMLIKDSEPSTTTVALDSLSQNERNGKINKKPLKALFKVVEDDILYEITSVMNYVEYLQSQIRRFESIQKYEKKMLKTKNENTKKYYREGIRLLLQPGETYETYSQLLKEYQDALTYRKQRIKDLYKEISIIKHLKL